MFFAHVSHETDGLKTNEEYCGRSGSCANNYQKSWCPIEAEPGKTYYGRGWFQLSYPCNYYAAGEGLGLDLLRNPEKSPNQTYLLRQQPSGFGKQTVWTKRHVAEILVKQLRRLITSNVDENSSRRRELNGIKKFDNVSDLTVRRKIFVVTC